MKIGQTGGDIPDKTPGRRLIRLSRKSLGRTVRTIRHHQIRTVAIHIIVTGMEKIRMTETVCNLVLCLEVLNTMFVQCHINLDRDLQFKRLIHGQPYLTERAAAQPTLQTVTPVNQCTR